KALRNVLHHAYVGSDVLTLITVSAGRGLDQSTLVVTERNGKTVDLGFGGEFKRRVWPKSQQAADTGNEILDLGGGERVVEREHRHAMLDLAEFLQRGCAHLRRRRGSGDEIGEALFDRFEAPAQLVVVAVGDDGCVILVI